LIPLLSLIVVLPLLGAPPTYVLFKQDRRLGLSASFAFCGATLFLSLYAYAAVLLHSPPPGAYLFTERYAWVAIDGLSVDLLLGLDGLGAVLLLLSCFLTLLAMLGSTALIREREAEYYALLLLFEGAINGVFTSLNLIFFYIFWDLVLIPMFLLIGIWGGPRRKYAALKFLLYTFTGSVVMLVGFLIAYFGADLRTFNLPELSGHVPVGLQFYALLASFIGFGIKLPVFPFHSWLPDAHVEAPAPVSVLLAGVLLKMGGYGFIRIGLGLFPQASQQLSFPFMLVGLVTMFYGAIVALLSSDLKRMIALTSINHMGYVLLGSYAALATGSSLGLQGAVFQMFNHGLAIGSLFLLSGYIHEQAGTRQIEELKGLRYAMPRTAVLLVLSSLAGMGFPFFSSFVSEFMVIAGAVAGNRAFFLAVLVPVLTGAYFMWMLRRTVMSEQNRVLPEHDIPLAHALVLLTFLVPLVALLVWPFPLIAPLQPLSEALGLR
jgi:NADH-quinone oxidoreductase subunit M